MGTEDAMTTDGVLIVLTAPLTETIDHAGYFIQMGVASMPKRLEGIFDSKYPQWKQLERKPDGSARERNNAHYARQLFARIKAHPCRSDFKVLVGGSGG